MSEYITFFVRKEENLVPIGTFSRSTFIFQGARTMFNINNIYGTAREIAPPELEQALRFCMGKRDYFEGIIANLESDIAAVTNFNNAVDEKLDAITTLRNEIEEVRGDVEEAALGVKWYSMLQLMRESTDEPIKFYCGIEVDEDLTVENLSK